MKPAAVTPAARSAPPATGRARRQKGFGVASAAAASATAFAVSSSLRGFRDDFEFMTQVADRLPPALRMFLETAFEKLRQTRREIGRKR